MVTRHVQFSVDRDYLPFLLLFVAGIAMIIIGQVGERLGWWNDIGTALNAAGAVASVMSPALAALLGASKKQVRTLGSAIVAGFEAQRHETRKSAAALDEHTSLLRQIRDRL